MKRLLPMIAVIILFVPAGCAWKYVYQVPNNQSELHFCRTEDGWDLAIARYKPAAINPAYYPVVLVHGMGHNSYIWDLDKTHSLATYLRDRGYDVWSVSLRGAGKSTKPAIGSMTRVAVINRLDEERIDPSKLDWNIDDHIHKDVPAVISYVKEKTGMSKVNWVGHSMGGMIICAYLERNAHADINAVVNMGGSLVFIPPVNRILQEVEKNKDIVRASVLVNTKFGSQIAAPLGGGVQTLSDLLSYNKDNTAGSTVSVFLANVVEDVYTGVLNQYLLFVEKKEFVSADKSYNYTANLSRIDVPILLIGGKVDQLSPPWTMFYMYSHVSSADKTIRIFGRQNHCAGDYGHIDLIIGERAVEEVYPFIAGWLDGRPAGGRPMRPPSPDSTEITGLGAGPQ